MNAKDALSVVASNGWWVALRWGPDAAWVRVVFRSVSEKHAREWAASYARQHGMDVVAERDAETKRLTAERDAATKAAIIYRDGWNDRAATAQAERDAALARAVRAEKLLLASMGGTRR